MCDRGGVECLDVAAVDERGIPACSGAGEVNAKLAVDRAAIVKNVADTVKDDRVVFRRTHVALWTNQQPRAGLGAGAVQVDSDVRTNDRALDIQVLAATGSR